jgi:hypothetical protein
MSLPGWIKAGPTGVVVVACFLASCGSDGDTSGGTSSATSSQVATPTVPQTTVPVRPRKSKGGATDAPARTTATAPAASSTSSATPGNQKLRGGGSKSAKETNAQRRRRRTCERQVAQLPPDQQRQALGECLNPAPPSSNEPAAPQPAR